MGETVTLDDCSDADISAPLGATLILKHLLSFGPVEVTWRCWREVHRLHHLYRLPLGRLEELSRGCLGCRLRRFVVAEGGKGGEPPSGVGRKAVKPVKAVGGDCAIHLLAAGHACRPPILFRKF